ncbi:alpha/beta-hydrolase [Annulohypoxylon maeteangense]|uniref:alpha/beta-hydrolase n=1 Tax=Annulohypoxylon maeteangense TaxID=1927788 RepID=UPI002008B03A|nr:alpha/beta-hydrolase [Annulohypoxylon maeteangense]KAI0884108.1 alpha/beta-hydrolase [Annulohypoxylon maeteangense]
MSSVSNLAVVICHGSYHTPAPYHPLIEKLEAEGIDAYCPQLPTADLTKLNVGDVDHPDFDRDPPGGGYPQGEADTDVILGVLRPLVNDKGKDVLMIGHSSGGWVATEAAKHELQLKSRKEKGLSGGVIGILYLGAFIVPIGESIHSFFQPKDGSSITPPFMTFHKNGAAGLGTIVEAEKFIFNGLEESDAKKWAAGLTASPVLTTKLSNNAYEALPCACLVLEGDLTLPKDYQEGMIALQTQKTGRFERYYCPAGHSPHLSWTGGVVDIIKDFTHKIWGSLA